MKDQFRIVQRKYDNGVTRFFGQVSIIMAGGVDWHDINSRGRINTCFGDAKSDIIDWKNKHAYDDPIGEIVFELDEKLDPKPTYQELEEEVKANEMMWIDLNKKSIRGQIIQTVLEYVCNEYPFMFVDEFAIKLQEILDSLIKFGAVVKDVEYDEENSVTTGHIHYYNNEAGEIKVVVFTVAPKDK